MVLCHNSRSIERGTVIVSILCAIIMLVESWHFIIFYLIFEMSFFMLIPMFTVSSRSYRKCYALATMYTVLILGSLSFYGFLSSELCNSSVTSSFD